MAIAADIFSAFLLFLIAYQDFSMRKVTWIALVLLFASSLVSSFTTAGTTHASIYTIINSSFIVLILFFLTFYFSLKKGKPTLIFDQFIGWGDVLFFLALAPALSPANYMLFFLASLLLSLAGYWIYSLIHSKNRNIPLAGCMAAQFLLCIVLKYFNLCLPFYDDSWLIMV